ncbi:hypothetical protein OHV05_24565 [Kitasatospora sp. NBC_00070]|uniref:hypothetical protein n=1 Tax=Kitasatospora sp. NBC_00070 TaxID=2975962 RepID=UPI0032438D11
MLDTHTAARLDRQLRELPDALVLAHLALLPGAGARGARVSGATRTAPLPCPVDVLSLFGPAAPGTVHDDHGDQDGIIPLGATIASWARLIAEQTGQCLVTGTVGGHLQFLARRPAFAFAILQPWADEYAAEIADVHQHATRLSRTRPRRTPMQMPCPACDMLSLVRQDGRDIECVTPGCSVLMRPGDYDWRVEQILAELEAA